MAKRRGLGLKKRSCKNLKVYFLAVILMIVSASYVYLQYSQTKAYSIRSRLHRSELLLKGSKKIQSKNKVNSTSTKISMITTKRKMNITFRKEDAPNLLGVDDIHKSVQKEDRDDIFAMELNDKSAGSCREPVTNIVVAKSHRTGASTLSSIILRYAYKNDLSYAFLNEKTLDKIDYTQYFSRDMVNGIFSQKFNILLTEGRFNKDEAGAVMVDKPVYLAIIRQPKEQFKSAFAFYDIAKRVHITDYPDPIGRFLTLSKTYFNLNARNKIVYALKNWQISDLGLGSDYHGIEHVVNYKLKQLSYDFDLVLIAEFFDQSLVLLKKLLCWSWEDLFYVAQNVRRGEEKQSITNYTESLLLQHNSADYKLYQYFNQTLWGKIKSYDGNFQIDLEYFKSKLREMENNCTDISNNWENDHKVIKPALKKDAIWDCTLTWMGEVALKRLIAEKMTTV